MSKSMKLAAWLVGALSITVGAYFSYEIGLLHALDAADKSKLSWLNIAIFTLFYLRLGYKLTKDYLKTRNELDPCVISQRELDPGYEAAEYCMGIGMLGTVIGFILMTSSMAGVDFSNIENVKQMFTVATSGMSTALLTTAVGIVASFALRFSHYVAGR